MAGRLEAAASAFQEAIAADPFSAEAHHQLAKTLRAQGEHFRAMTSFERAVELRHVGDGDRRAHLGDQLQGCDQPRRVARELEGVEVAQLLATGGQQSVELVAPTDAGAEGMGCGGGLGITAGQVSHLLGEDRLQTHAVGGVEQPGGDHNAGIVAQRHRGGVGPGVVDNVQPGLSHPRRHRQPLDQVGVAGILPGPQPPGTQGVERRGHRAGSPPSDQRYDEGDAHHQQRQAQHPTDEDAHQEGDQDQRHRQGRCGRPVHRPNFALEQGPALGEIQGNGPQRAGRFRMDGCGVGIGVGGWLCGAEGLCVHHRLRIQPGRWPGWPRPLGSTPAR